MAELQGSRDGDSSGGATRRRYTAGKGSDGARDRVCPAASGSR